MSRAWTQALASAVPSPDRNNWFHFQISLFNGRQHSKHNSTPIATAQAKTLKVSLARGEQVQAGFSCKFMPKFIGKNL